MSADDLMERLRAIGSWDPHGNGVVSPTARDAAARIEALEAKLAAERDLADALADELLGWVVEAEGWSEQSPALTAHKAARSG